MPTRVLVLPGIGDILWVAVALQDFAKQRGLTDLEVWVWDFDGRRRSLEYVERIPFVRAGGYFHKPPHPFKQPAFQASYYTGQASVFPGHLGFDFYLAANGVLRHGGTVEQALGCATNWYFPLLQTPGEIAYQAQAANDYGPYVVCHFSDFGIFKPWIAAWGVAGCAHLVNTVHQATGYRMLLTGCEWDKSFSDLVAARCRQGVLSIAGATTPDQFFGLLRGARGVLGWCGGNTILATTLKLPTLILWSRVAFPHTGFYQTSCPPDAWGKHYRGVAVEDVTAHQAALAFIKLLQRAPNDLP